jgi:two-component system, OmpR family, response regulator
MGTSHGEAWLRALCVDDNKDCADSAAMLLRVMGFEAKACYDGGTALALNETFRPGVCFLDLNMPGMEGDEVCRRMLSSGGWRPFLIVAVTAMSNDESRARTKAAGFHLHLVKPVDSKSMMEVTDALMRAARL